MKKQLLLAVAICFSTATIAQIPFNTKDSININKINATVLVHGDMWWDPVVQVAACEFPAGSKKHINFAGALWMSGYDAANTLHVSAQTYRQDGNDYWPGPLDSSDTLTYATSNNWAKIWKIYRTEIQYFQSLATHTTTNTPQAILRWPGKGNTFAQGNAGVPLTITEDMAPFVDLNSNGNYEPLLGEYPDVRGDQALWWVFSDKGPSHSQSSGKPFGIEVHAMAYAYSRSTLIDYVVYYDYTLINKSADNYHDMRVALHDDIDIGYYRDDYIGFDSLWRMGIDYNGFSDDGLSAGHPDNSYGPNPPMAGVTMIVLPGDVGSSYVPVGSFGNYNWDHSIYGYPSTDTQFNHLMRARLANSVHFKDYVGNEVNYEYPDDPSQSLEWSECSVNNYPANRRFVLSSNDFILNAGNSAHIVMALVVADSVGGCPVGSFNKIKIVADTAWKNYYYPPPPKAPNSISSLTTTHDIDIYPNPAKDKLYIEHTGNYGNDATIQVFNSIGQSIPLHIINTGRQHEADISLLPAGLYNVLYMQDGLHSTAKFIKE